MRSLFPDQNPPAIAEETAVDEACIWLLAVMDESNNARRFVASLLNQYFERGWLSEKQMSVLQEILLKTARKHAAGELEAQGATPAKKQGLTVGKVIPAFGRDGTDDGEVLE